MLVVGLLRHPRHCVAADFRPAIAFLDIGLPVMDRYELAARVRGWPELNGVRLIALTGYGQESDRKKTRDAGFRHRLRPAVDLSDAFEGLVAGSNIMRVRGFHETIRANR